ncbi:MAG: dipeptidase [Xanthomonadales bacterium]|nr:dipeptidase [Xanthomonadales bacterium]
MNRKTGTKTMISLLLTLLMAPAGMALAADDLKDAAQAIARSSMMTDTHIDVPYRLKEHWEDVTVATEGGDFDYVRARAGGLDIPFMSIFTPPSSEDDGSSFKLANSLIDNVEALVGRAPDKFVMVRSPREAEQAWKAGKIGLAMGMENGSPIEGKLENVAFFKDRGISYITLAHGKANHLSDSSYDEERKWSGLSPFGKQVLAEMNRLGVMVDVSHLSDDAFWQVIELSEVPVIASHSSVRHFTPGWERNMSDEMIKAMAAKGGIIQINFGSSFISNEARLWFDEMVEARKAWMAENGYDKDSPERWKFKDIYIKDHPFPYADMDDLMAHFTHVIELVGIEHVGIGSDFDGVGDSLPEGMKDVSFYPNLVERFLQLEYPIRDIEAVMSGNLMRVWREAEAYAAKAAAGP